MRTSTDQAEWIAWSPHKTLEFCLRKAELCERTHESAVRTQLLIFSFALAIISFVFSLEPVENSLRVLPNIVFFTTLILLITCIYTYERVGAIVLNLKELEEAYNLLITRMGNNSFQIKPFIFEDLDLNTKLGRALARFPRTPFRKSSHQAIYSQRLILPFILLLTSLVLFFIATGYIAWAQFKYSTQS